MVASLEKDKLLQFLLGRERTPEASEMFCRVLAFLLVQGYGSDQLAEVFDDPSVKHLAGSERVMKAVLKMQTTFAIPLQERIEQMGSLAFERKAYIALHGDNLSTSDRATTDLLDRALGKAIQRMDVRSQNMNVTGNISELDTKIQAALKKVEALQSMHKTLQDSKEVSK